MTKRDYYEVLSVTKTANGDEIKRSYRKLAMQYHPDRNPGDAEAEAKFKEAAEAYDVLSDQDKKARYDRYGHAGLSDGPGGGPAGFGDINSIFDLFGDIFGSNFGGGGGGRSRRPSGQDLQVDLEIDLAEAAKGTSKPLEFNRAEICGECSGSRAKKGSKPVRCSRCQGRGVVISKQGFFQVQTTCPSCGGQGSTISDPCDTCDGQGMVMGKRKLQISIPPGVDSGSRIRLQGEGEVTEPGGPRGDLYCRLRVKPHPIFQRDGTELLCEVPVAFSQAALGAELEVPTLNGPTQLTLPRGTNHGDIFRIRGQGMPDIRGKGTGDLLVRAKIEVPKKLTKRQEELLRELAELDQKHVSPERKGFLDRVKDWFAESEQKNEAKS